MVSYLILLLTVLMLLITAYKHIPIRLEDIGLQVFRLGDRYFVDRGLSFGGSTSPPLFDDPAELVAQMSHWEAGVSRHKSVRQLDDTCSAGTWTEVMAVYNSTKSISDYTGIHLADENDPEKAFSPTKSGIILGITYSLKEFMWRLARWTRWRIFCLTFWKMTPCPMVH